MKQENRIKELEAKIAKDKVSFAKLSKELEKLRSEMYDKIEPYEKEIKKIEAKYEPLIHVLDVKCNNLQDNVDWKIAEQIKRLKDEINIRDARKNGVHTDITVRSLMSEIGKTYDDVIEKTSLPNGVKIFRVSENHCYTMWLAFKGFDLVGLSYRRQGQHRGDSTYPYSYIGGLLKHNLLLRNVEYGRNATFTQWSEMLKTVRLILIPLTPKVKKCIKEAESLDGYNWGG